MSKEELNEKVDRFGDMLSKFACKLLELATNTLQEVIDLINKYSERGREE